jgi:hypothetical protein
VTIERRTFLKSATQALLAAPALASLMRSQTAHAAIKETMAVGGPKTPPVFPPLVLNVKDLGAVGDGTTRDTLALQQTIDRVSVLGGGEVLVPAGTFLTGALRLRSNVRLHLTEGAVIQGSPDIKNDYPVAQVRWEGRWIKGYPGFISAWDAENVAILGPGTILGSEAVKGRVERPSGLRLPSLLEFVNCRNVWVENVKTLQFGMWSTHPVLCQNVTFKNTSFKSGADGIDVDSCQHVTIDGCTFDTGDDCISLKSGRGQEAWAQIPTRPQITCEDILITHCTFTDSNFACIGIGSETSGGVRNARVESCKFIGAKTHAIYIKSRPGRGAFIEDIHCRDLDVSNAKLGFLRLNNLNSGKADEFSVPGLPGIPEFKNFSFRDVRVTDMPHLVQATEISPEKPLVGLVLENITGTCQKGMEIANARDVVLKDIKVTGFTGPLLATFNVTGKGLEGAVPLPEESKPKPTLQVPEPPVPYKLGVVGTK